MTSNEPDKGSSASPAVHVTVVVPSGKRALVTVKVPCAVPPPGPLHEIVTGCPCGFEADAW
jgi:hypothetical protein